MLNNFGEIESGLSVLLVHVQKHMLASRLYDSTTGNVQDMMVATTKLMKENDQAKLRQDLTIEERLEVKNIEEQIDLAQAKLRDMMTRKTNETKEGKDNKSKIKEDLNDDSNTNGSRVASKPFNFIDEIFQKL